MTKKKFLYHFTNARWAKGRHETYVCYVLERRDSPVSRSLDFGYLRNIPGSHAEELLLRILSGWPLDPLRPLCLTLYASWSPCAQCSHRLATFLQRWPNLTLRLFVARLYYCQGSGPHPGGLRRLRVAGVSLGVMGYTDYSYCWDNFVARRGSQFKGWDGLQSNSVRISRLLRRILQPLDEFEDFSEAFLMLGL
ncbi:single-stranded DNA cytosine deaminase [Leucoraja erinacea]|uniref:single-stranded DNA cytosine deaminase n=1 Tax=Leucoraja erinaceus TaxID=7782 RepID=UPI0024565F66|nr:single-stranded DNA cytosine deaminase [Leucoraja erinacea]